MTTLLVHVENLEDAGRETRAFGPGVVRIGRSRLNDLVLPHPAISQFHARVEFDGAGAVLVPGRSTNEVRCDDAPVAADARVPLSERSVVTLGPIALRFGTSEASVEAGDAPPAWFADRFAWERGKKVDERAATEGYRPSALRSYVEAMLPGEVAGARPNDDPLAAWITHWTQATEGLAGAIRARLESLPTEARADALHALGVQHPPLRLTPAVQELARQLGVRWDEDLAELALLRWRQLAFQYGATPPSTGAELDAVVVRLVRGVAALAEGFSAMRAAFEPWALVAATRDGAAPGEAPQGDGDAVVAWLLAEERAGEKPSAVRRTFAELAARPSVIAGAAARGVRALMDRWSPFALEQEMAALRGVAALDAEGAAAVWSHWREVFRWWATNEPALHAAVFGQEFAEALHRDAGARWERGG